MSSTLPYLAFSRCLLRMETLDNSFQDTVILEAIEVWNLTCILTSPHLPFHMAYSAHPTSDGHDPAEELPIPIPNTIPPDNGPSPDAILASTFLARFERRAEGLCRSLLREIESRLMRGKKHGMDVFFVGMLVLASLARIEWFVRGFELEDKAHLVSSCTYNVSESLPQHSYFLSIPRPNSDFVSWLIYPVASHRAPRQVRGFG